ncbi:siderophore-interacting protein [Luteipulveratus mongoliensis]|uniref:FAD-binding protein n=1 Tax=Luteipulveratus mongoliensis TaxID=571913 RepID=A0A0K1JMD9_9MICO|nr:siderophore-interacting protein [Luteipulveratus mongoliensis]AKU17745.1 FAD-binding protein [Luteipulveratus mongoliensis]
MANAQTPLTVMRTERITDHLVRVVLGGPGFAEFAPNEFTDMYVKLALIADGEEVVRTYTVRAVDPQRRELSIDFVVHGEEGVAGRWAAEAQPGDEIGVRGPGGAYRPATDADWHLLAGDESAIPAIAAALESLPADAVGYAFIEVADAGEEIALAAPAGVRLTWVHRGGAAGEVPDDQAGVNSPLVQAVRDAAWLPGEPHVFIHGEAQTVMHGLRGYIRKERGVPAARASISGYWRRGRTEEGFRVWKRELATAEA